MAKFVLLSGLPSSEERWVFMCPGCGCGHQVRTKGAKPIWSWNGNVESPTVSPSVMLNRGPLAAGQSDQVCHFYIHDGNIQFLSDSTHHLSGMTVPIPEFDL